MNSKVLTEIQTSKAGSVQQIINTKVIQELIIPVPSIEEQKSLIRRIKMILLEINNLQKILSKKISEYSFLKSAILSEEIKGEII